MIFRAFPCPQSISTYANHQSRPGLDLGVVGPPELLADRGRQWPGFRPHKNISKTGKLVKRFEGRGVAVEVIPAGVAA